MHATGAAAVGAWLILRIAAGVQLHTDCWQGEDPSSSGVPWHVSLFWRSDEQTGIFQYLGAGVLISERHVLSDMSGFDGYRTDWIYKNFSEIFVMLGNPSIHWNPEANADTQVNKVTDVFFQPEYSQAQYWYYRHSIAVIELEVPVDFTNKVKPACIDSSSPIKDGEKGLVAAPNLTGSSVPKLVKVDYVSRKDCVDRDETVTTDKFCVNSHDEALCPEGVGGALLVRSADGRWLLKGVISVNSARKPFAVDSCAANLSVISSVDQQTDFILSSVHRACYIGPSKLLPWHAVIYKELTNDSQLQYICGGTLLSRIFIVSDGSCFWNSSKEDVIDTNQIVVALGKRWKSADIGEPKAQFYRVSSVSLSHPDRAEGVALLRLESPAVFRDNVAAVCLDTAREKSADQISFGTVAAMGDNEFSSVKIHGLSYANYNECSDENITQPVEAFCAKSLKAPLCPETVGSGLLVRGPGGQWLLKGVARPLPGSASCQLQSTVFTSADHALRWILDIMRNLTVLPLLNPGINNGCWSDSSGPLPWHALLYRPLQRPDLYSVTCAGSLVTRRLVLSNLDCFLDKDSGEVNIEDMRIAVGKQTRDWKAADHKVQIRKVSRIAVMDDDKENSNTLALATLETPVTFNDGVHSICLDFSGSILEEQLELGVVPIFDAHRAPNITLLNMTISNTSSCLKDIGENLNSSNKLCATDHEAAWGLCEMNSGAGLAVRSRAGAWLLGGVVHARETRPPRLSCQGSSTALTAVSSYLPWLRRLLRARQARD